MYIVLTDKIQELLHRRKKCVDHNVEKYITFGHISWKNVCQLMNFSA